MLELRNIEAAYGNVQILHGITFSAKAGEITCVLGRNGAGKSTTIKSIMGLVSVTSGSIAINGEEISGIPKHNIPGKGIAYVPQGRRLFSELSVEENIEIGLMTRGAGKDTKEWVLSYFPRLRERMRQRADTLSGGEQQMLAMARAMCIKPSILLLDEPTEGLQPSMAELIRNVTLSMRDENVAVVLVEQRVEAIRAQADNLVFLENGKNLETLNAQEIISNPERLTRNLGI